MSQLYARVFLQILDSSIAEDFTVRHVFEDFLKLADSRSGCVDMTRQSLSRRLNVPIETLNAAIQVLESPDPHSRDKEFEGRRIERLDEHRDWGWQILNWAKYDEIKTRVDAAMRTKRYRANIGDETPEFMAFWQAYPSKVAKSVALKAWHQIPDVNTLLPKIMAGLVMATKSDQWTKDNGQFIPNPSTWLNQRRWEDKPKEKLAPQRPLSQNF